MRINNDPIKREMFLLQDSVVISIDRVAKTRLSVLSRNVRQNNIRKSTLYFTHTDYNNNCISRAISLFKNPREKIQDPAKTLLNLSRTFCTVHLHYTLNNSYYRTNQVHYIFLILVPYSRSLFSLRNSLDLRPAAECAQNVCASF